MESHPIRIPTFSCVGYRNHYFDYSELNLNQYSVASPCRTICTVCGSSPCPDLNLIHYICAFRLPEKRWATNAHLFAADSLISLRLTLSGSLNRLRRNPLSRLCRPHSQRSGRTGWGGWQRCRRCPRSASSVRIWPWCWGGLRR